MSKDEFLKIQTCVLKVNIHCDGCKHKVKKILQKIEGVYTTKIDAEQGKVTVSGNIDANTLIKKLIKNGKHAEIWGAKPNNSNAQNHLNQFKNQQLSNAGKGGDNNKGQGQKGGGNHQPKGGGGGGGGGPQGQNPHLQQMKGFQDMKMLPQFMKDMKLSSNNGKDQNAKAVKFKLPEDEDLSDGDYDDDDFDDDEFDDDDDLDDEMDHGPPNKMKPMLGNGHGGSQMPNMMMQNMVNGQLPQHLKPGGNGGNNGGNSGGNGKKGGGGGGGNVPVQMNHGGGSGKKGGNGGGNPNQGGGAKGGKNGGGGGGQNKNGGGPANGNPFMANGAKKGNDGPHGMPNMMMSGANMGQHMGNMPQMGHMSNLPMGQMSNLAAVQGLPAPGMASGGGPGYGGGGAEHMQGNPYYQQQLAAMMMNQQRANGNERFQPMMYARPPPAVNYMPPYPPYPYPPPPGERADQYSMFSDENTSSCSVM